jgi:tetratricopeptide (TPR) repeat protein
MHEETIAGARELGAAIWVAEILGELGQDEAARGQLGLAARLLAEAVAIAPDALKFVIRALLAQADVALQSGRPAEALEHVQHLRDTAPQFRVFVADAGRAEGEALAALGRADEALVALRQAKAEAVAMNAEPPRWRACLALAELLDRRGQPDQAAVERAEARASLEAVAASLPDADLRRSFLSSEPTRRARQES